LRNHIEASFWSEAVALLLPEDHARLQELVHSAWDKLRGDPIQIPHAEHRDLHLTIYSRLDNPFVRGVLEVYWEAYEAVGLSVYADYAYLREVWEFHQKMVDAIVEGNPEIGYQALVAHTDLLQARPELARASASRSMSRRVTA
jgi:DNA-binding FadR family transcriptional regulator